MLEKYNDKNIRENYYISMSPHESTIEVNRYIKEGWSFDGNHFKKTTADTSSSSVKIPLANYSIGEYLAYVDELQRMRDYLIVIKPVEPRKVA